MYYSYGIRRYSGVGPAGGTRVGVLIFSKQRPAPTISKHESPAKKFEFRRHPFAAKQKWLLQRKRTGLNAAPEIAFISASPALFSALGNGMSPVPDAV